MSRRTSVADSEWRARWRHRLYFWPSGVSWYFTSSPFGAMASAPKNSISWSRVSSKTLVRSASVAIAPSPTAFSIAPGSSSSM